MPSLAARCRWQPVVTAALVMLAFAGGVMPLAAADPPWVPSFTTEVRGAQRHFVAYAGRTWMLVEPADLAAGIADQLEVAVSGKLRRLAGGAFGMHRATGVVLHGQALAQAQEGDNVHALGRVTVSEGRRVFAVWHLHPAPSDAELLRARAEGVPADDWEGRLAVVQWCRAQAARVGDPDVWTRMAEELLRALVDDMARVAAQRKDTGLLVRACDLALQELDDRVLTARLASPSWVREVGGPEADALARRLRALGFALYREAWLPRPQALEREFEERFAALSWRDADGFYRLGRWADEQAEELPRARERAWRCYQAGLQADPTHAGIRRELGLTVVPRQGPQSGEAASGPAQWTDAATGVRVRSPAGWRTAGEGRWLHPDSETAAVSVRIVPPPARAEAYWELVLREAAQRSGFAELGQLRAEAIEGQRQRWQLQAEWHDGRERRLLLLALIAWDDSDAPLVLIEGEGMLADQALLEAAAHDLAVGCAR
ncbi:MAG: hypothetical protein NZ552_05430 [Planctomycetes bacterium]|nr:hypothetical protein [Planctomycetota bacterium]